MFENTPNLIPDFLTISVTIISIVGGIAGILSFLWIFKRKIWGKVELIHSIGYIDKLGTPSTKAPIEIETHLIIKNNRDVSIALTDILGTLKYDKEQYSKDVNKKDSEQVFSFHPVILTPALPINIRPDEVVALKLRFKTVANILNLERCRSLHLIGFYDDIPHLIGVDEHNIKSPIHMRINLDFGGSLMQTETPIYNTKEEFDEHGTIGIVKKAEIERNWR